MASFQATQRQLERGVNEERQFTNPHVRFRRIRGRIVPIFNKKRIGQDVSQLGADTAKIGSALGAIGLVKRTKPAKSIAKVANKFAFNSSPFFKIKKKDSFKRKALKKSFKAISSTSRFTFKNAGKLGILGIAAGIGLKLVGDETQARSPFGKDFFFTKDRDGRGS